MTNYADAGVNIAEADAAKKQMKGLLKSNDKRVLNTVGAFASLFDGRFPGYKHPVLVLKTEEPGSKQLLAIENGKIGSLCQDLIHHLLNDIVVMGATPLSVQDCIVCGKLEKKVITKIVHGMAAACRTQGCVLTGGETSEQPGTVPAGTYVLTASVVGVVEKSHIIDGKKIRKGDRVLAVASNGLHTNGYSLVRRLMKEHPGILKERVGKDTFLNAILKPHTCYYRALRTLFGNAGLHGLAHITGGGIGGNLNRILPKNLDASINVSAIDVLPVFNVIQRYGDVADGEMLRTYNMGVGLTIVADPKAAPTMIKHLKKSGHDCYDIGEIVPGKGSVTFRGNLR